MEDKFTLKFPRPDKPKVIYREIPDVSRKDLLESIRKNVPQGFIFIGLEDEDGFDQGDVDFDELEPGTYTLVYNAQSEGQIITEISPQSLSGAFYAMSAVQNTDDSFKELSKSLCDGNHDILAAAKGTVHINTAKWYYLVALTSESVIVSINCSISQADFLEFTTAIKFTSSCGQGNGFIHPLAYSYAAALPMQTFVSLCTSDSVIFDWKSVPHLQNNAGNKKLIFTGKSTCGTVAHVAALLAREMSMMLELGIEVSAICYNAPNGVTEGISEALIDSNISQQHVTFCKQSDTMMMCFQVAFDVQMAKQITNGELVEAETLISNVKTILQSSNSKAVADAWKKFKSLEQSANDMISAHMSTIHPWLFVPIGSFEFTKSTVAMRGLKSVSVVARKNNFIDIKEEIASFQTKSSGVKIAKSHGKIKIPLEFRSELKLPLKATVLNFGETLKPTVNQCYALEVPSEDKKSSRIELTLIGSNLENIIQRTNGTGVGIDFVGRRAISKSPILFRDMKSIEISNTSVVIVTSASKNESKLLLTHAKIRSEGDISIFNDFGESKPFRPTQYHTLENSNSKLRMFSTFNDDFLVTAFLRSMMLILSNPSHYVDPKTSKLIEENIPTALSYQFEVECLILESRDSELKQIVNTYCNQPDGLPYACSKARQVIDKIIMTLMVPFKLECDGKFKSAFKKIAGAFGVVTGGVVMIVGTVLTIPGLLLALIPAVGAVVGAMTNSSSSMTVFGLSTIPGLLLALPGAGIGIAGLWLVGRSFKAIFDKTTMQYAQLLKLMLKITGGDPTKVLDEVPSLEESLAKQFRSALKSSSLKDSPVELWEVTDKQLHTILKEKIEVTDEEIAIYTILLNHVQHKLRNWMRAAGRIYCIREIIEKHIVIGFVGVHNAGKTSWINSLFNLNLVADSIQRTEKAELHSLAVSQDPSIIKKWKENNHSLVQVGVVDFPGATDEREMIATMAERLANVTTLFVCVFRFGHVAGPEKEVVDMIKNADRDFLVLINQSDISKDLHAREQEYRTNYANVLEIDPSMIHFVSIFDAKKADYVRHLLWGHLNLLVDDPNDQLELGIHLLDSKAQTDIIQNIPAQPETIESYLRQKILAPFYSGRENEPLFEKMGIFYNLSLSTRIQPVKAVPTTAFKEYEGFSSNMDFLSRLELFRQRIPIPFSFLATTISLSTGNLFFPLCAALMELDQSSLASGIRISLENDSAVDAGGVLRSVFVSIAKNLQEGENPFFKCYDNNAVYFNPILSQHSELILRGFGRMIGICILQGISFPANFSISLFKLILAQPISFKDFEMLDLKYCTSISKICEMNAEDIENLCQYFCTTYTIENGIDCEIELIPGGKDIQLSAANLTEYLRTLILHRLGNHLPLQEFVLGVSDVIPRNKLTLFSPQMLQLLLNGVAKFSCEELLAAITVRDPAPSEQVLKWFRECIHEMTDEDRTLLLTFITGSSVVPAAGLKGIDPPISIGLGLSKLPKSHTCFNSLEIFDYESKEQLRENLLFALRNFEPISFGMV